MAGATTKESFLKELELSRFNKLLAPGVRANLVSAIGNAYDDESLQGVYAKFRAQEDKLIVAENEEKKKEARKLEKIEEKKRLKEEDIKERLESAEKAQQLIAGLNKPIIAALKNNLPKKSGLFLLLAILAALMIAGLVYKMGWM